MYKIDKIDKEAHRAKILKRIVEVILCIVIIPILLFNLILIFQSILYPNRIPEIFGYKVFVIVSKSMLPTIKVGDAIFIKEVPENELKVGDIISFRTDGYINTHRIKEITTDENGNKQYVTKGDNNKDEDRQRVRYSDIEGIYTFKLAGLGKIMNLLQNKVFLIFLAIIVISYLIYMHKLKLKKERRKELRKKYIIEK